MNTSGSEIKIFTGNAHKELAADIAKDFGIKVYTIGIGAKEVAVTNSFGTKVVANTELDETLLKRIAETTGGEYFRASSTENFRQIFNKIDALEKTKIESMRKNIRVKLNHSLLLSK